MAKLTATYNSQKPLFEHALVQVRPPFSPFYDAAHLRLLFFYPENFCHELFDDLLANEDLLFLARREHGSLECELVRVPRQNYKLRLLQLYRLH